MLTLALLSRRHRRRDALVAAACGLAVFAAAPQWWFPSGGNLELRWAAWQQVLGSSYVILAAGILLLSALLPQACLAAGDGDLQRGAVGPCCDRPIRDISWGHDRSSSADSTGF